MKAALHNNKFVVIPNFFDQEEIDLLYFRFNSARYTAAPNSDIGFVNGDHIVVTPALEDLHNKAGARLSTFLSTELLPTYAYCREYYKGSSMISHTDRWPCEISITFPVSSVGDVSPISFKTNSGDIDIAPRIGDIICYKGYEIQHYRKEQKAESLIQIFFHFIDTKSEHGSFYKALFDRSDRDNGSFANKFKNDPYDYEKIKKLPEVIDEISF